MTHYLSIPRQIVRLYLKESDAGLEEGHREADHGQDGEHVEGAAGEVTEVEHGVEQLIPFIVNIEEITLLRTPSSPAHIPKRTFLSV